MLSVVEMGGTPRSAGSNSLSKPKILGFGVHGLYIPGVQELTVLGVVSSHSEVITYYLVGCGAAYRYINSRPQCLEDPTLQQKIMYPKPLKV